ncbi:MAG TPA: hypothetical protein VMJ64_03290 [Anaerolineales bacterium]|nr:hypothetical protein [Anaerolineales bacterium]
MPSPRFALLSISLILALLAAACTPKALTPGPDEMSTAAAALAITFLTRTAAAASSTPTITLTPPPTDTPTPAWTATPEHTQPMVMDFAGCYYGPGPTYTLESNIKKGKRVELLGMGSQSGWYIIRNPYFHKPCWIAAAYLQIDAGVNTAALPVMTPGAPRP